ncbi:MAG: hypothetical protein AABZ06_05705 [Bdellovibrionota bacterium]
MKKTIITLLMSLAVPINSYAIEADHFACTIEITENHTGISTKQDIDFYLARHPLSASPAPDILMTSTYSLGKRIVITNSLRSITANLTFKYDHAVKIDHAGNILDARQATCFALSADWCAHADSSSCPTSSLACVNLLDPFDPHYGWPIVGHADNVPTFNEKALVPRNEIIRDVNGNDVGVAKASCRHMGTYR